MFGPSTQIDLGAKSSGVTGDRWTYDAVEDVYTILDGAEVVVKNKTSTSRIVVEVGATVTLTLNGALINLDGKAGKCPIDLADGATATINLSGENMLKAGFGAPGIHVPAGAMLFVSSADGDGTTGGSLTAEGGTWAAGIGSRFVEEAGAITISGGTVSAIGGERGSGIGGGSDAAGGVIRITGGSVTAEGGKYAAGIGGGAFGDGGDIRITGGSGSAKGYRSYDTYGAAYAVGPGGFFYDLVSEESSGSFSGPSGPYEYNVDGWPTANPYEWY
ncbi:MAG: hypothetical protein MdMp014T_2075 [Treponematales bacterium]